ncbi:MAG TPA: methylenetetrahydrofolate reductase [NAD(P)H] [Propionibacteriaceae bacterium]|nr:methylenetetrahydrofolate reductase [NAD(P)H] [Propionibacteriaceae bacterium]
MARVPCVTSPDDDQTVADLLRSGRTTYSFEFFPPRTPEDADRLWQTLDHLQEIEPDFVSVTYGANGSNRDRTLAITERLARESSLRTVGHLTCASQSRADIVAAIEAYRDAGVRHVLAIRGDMPGGPTEPWIRHPEGLANATELVRLVRETGDFCVGVGAFPDPHPQALDAELDARLLMEKAEAGAEFAITQLFFRPEAYLSLVDRVRALGCDIPIVPGIMPITQIGQVKRFAEFSGAQLPAEIVARLEAVADDPKAVREVGVDIATELALAVLEGGAPGLHFFTQNRSTATRAIFQRVHAAQG